MRFEIPLLAALSAIVGASPTGTDNPSFFYKPVTVTFHGGPATYDLNMVADGNNYPTNNGLNINLITSPSGFPIYQDCVFYTAAGPYPPDTKVKFVSNPDGSIAVGPPQPIVSVNCKPTPGGSNTCLPVYASCEWCGGGFGGCQVLNCCSGYCAATKCRPTS